MEDQGDREGDKTNNVMLRDSLNLSNELTEIPAPSQEQSMGTSETTIVDLGEFERPEVIPTDEDPFLFRKMRRRLRDQYHKFKETLFSGRSQNPMLALESTASLAISVPSVDADEATKTLACAFRALRYSFNRNADGQKPIPLFLDLLQVKVSVIPLKDHPLLHLHFQRLAGHEGGRHSVAYEIELIYADSIKWKIHRRLLDFVRLHSVLMFRSIQGQLSVTLPPFPTHLTYLLNAAGMGYISTEDRLEFKKKAVAERRDALERYLRQLFHALNMQPNASELFEFLECSHLTLRTMDPESLHQEDYSKEGYLKNRVFEIQRPPAWYDFIRCCVPRRRKYRTKWFVLRGTYIAVCDTLEQGTPSDLLLCDKDFHVIVENEGSRQILRPLTVTIVNSCKKLEVRAERNSQMIFWLESLRSLALNCVWAQPHRFGSFAPLRSNCRVKWLIDCQAYYDELVKVLLKAKREIFIHGWWVSPELYLKRPSSKHPEMRLDRILQQKAKEGVSVYILVFKEFPMALSLNSYHTKASFERLHPNIRVQRHPDHLAGVLYWAHHEKIVAVDQEIAFTGGLDLCFGRYDDQSHRIVDFNPDDPTSVVWSGLDYSNPRIKDFKNVIMHSNALVDRRKTPRMAWHDVQVMLTGQPARDLCRHFIERWNYVKQQKSMHKEEHIPFLLPQPEFSPRQLEADHLKGSVRVQILRSVSEWSMGMAPETSIYEAYLFHIRNAKHFIYMENQFFISRSSEKQEFSIRNRIAQAIVERIIKAHQDGNHTFRVMIVLPLMPAFEAAIHQTEASSVRVIMQAQFNTICRGPHSMLAQLAEQGIKAEDYITFFALRTHSLLDGKAVTEQVYPHCKLMVVDDEVAMLGSANINDRSLLGVRDSEVNVIVEDDEKVTCTFSGHFSTTVGPKVRELRVKLMQEHLGLLDLPPDDPRILQLNDPTDPEFYHRVLRRQASLNTQVYRELFRCVPDDCVTTWDEYRRFTESPRVPLVDAELGINAMDMLNAVQGQLVFYPLNFMKKEDLAASLLSLEFLLPLEVYL